jgi:mercuric ion transport protein
MEGSLMDGEKRVRVARLGMAASVVTALGASICCIGPIVAVTFGMSSLAALAKYEPLRPIFGAVTVVLLAVAFYVTYKRPAACEPGSVCATHGGDRVQTINRAALWIGTAVAVAVFTFPTWSAWFLG